MHYVYILKSLVDGSYYKGCTDDLRRRLQKHNAKSVRYSSTKVPYRLEWYCAFKDKDKAFAFERYLKIGSGFAFAKKHLI
jgi:putative endonuclease